LADTDAIALNIATCHSSYREQLRWVFFIFQFLFYCFSKCCCFLGNDCLLLDVYGINSKLSLKLVGVCVSVHRLFLFFSNAHHFPDPLIHSVSFSVYHFGKLPILSLSRKWCTAKL